MRSRTIAIVGSIAALMFAAGPVSAIAATHSSHRPATETTSLDRSRDASGTDRSSGDVSGTDRSAGDFSGSDHAGSYADSSLDG